MTGLKMRADGRAINGRVNIFYLQIKNAEIYSVDREVIRPQVKGDKCGETG